MQPKRFLYFTMMVLLAAVLGGRAYAQGQTITVKGLVLDSTGAPVPGAVVIDEGKKGAGSVTGPDGSYSIQTGVDATLTFKCLGYTDHIEKVDFRSTIDIVL